MLYNSYDIQNKKEDPYNLNKTKFIKIKNLPDYILDNAIQSSSITLPEEDNS